MDLDREMNWKESDWKNIISVVFAFDKLHPMSEELTNTYFFWLAAYFILFVIGSPSLNIMYWINLFRIWEIGTSTTTSDGVTEWKDNFAVQNFEGNDPFKNLLGGRQKHTSTKKTTLCSQSK